MFEYILFLEFPYLMLIQQRAEFITYQLVLYYITSFFTNKIFI